MKTIHLAIGIHNHQPVGNFDFVFEEAYQKAYLPFLQVLERFSHIKLAQHFSGILLEWIAELHPEYIKRLREMVQSGHIEMMTGGYYEPILITVPDQDKIGQISKLTEYVAVQTGYQASGIWLTERVWEPTLPEPMVKAGITYTLTDDSHFKSAGLREDQLYGYFITEDNGAAIKIFPISEKLRYTIPFRPPEETIEYLRSLATEDGERMVVFADDGEKFGVWPHTYEQCYQHGWLERFFQLLHDNSDWINLISFSEALHKLPPQGRIYLPTASYREMMEWALPSDTILRYEDFEKWLVENEMSSDNKAFVHGGFWRNFLAKYAESNNLHKRMLRSSRRMARLLEMHKNIDSSVIDQIYAGQCNCPYWHGVFGGLYLPNLRYPIYHNLIQADVAMDKLERDGTQTPTGWVAHEKTDFDQDGFEELILESDRMNLFFSPRNGGALFELDLKPARINLLDTMTRREEAYHRKLLEAINHSQAPKAEADVASIHDLILMKEENLDRYLNYDWYRRSSLIDHFLRDDVTLDAFYKARYGEQGDFVNQPYQAQVSEKADGLDLTLSRNGHVWIGDRHAAVQVEKRIHLRAGNDSVAIQYKIQNTDAFPAQVWFGSESAFALMAGDAPDRYYASPEVEIADRKLASMGELGPIVELGLYDEWLKLSVRMVVDKPAVFWRFPIETVSLSEAGFERVYQCSVVMPNWRISLQPGEIWSVKIGYHFEQIK